MALEKVGDREPIIEKPGDRKEGKDKLTLRKFLRGKKTKLGGWACFLAGALQVSSIWYPFADRIATGIFYAGMGVIGVGIWARLRDIFHPYHTPDGKTAWHKPIIKPPKVGG